MRFPIITTLTVAAMLLAGPASASEPLGSTFNYQGRLMQNGDPASGPHAMVFTLFDAQTGGAQIGDPEIFASVQVSDGLFTVQLDFGDAIFTGAQRWLEIEVEGVTLLPRQPVRPAPYALALPGLWTVWDGLAPNIIGGNQSAVEDGRIGATIGGGATEVMLEEVAKQEDELLPLLGRERGPMGF
jgi:hypothetical protein